MTLIRIVISACLVLSVQAQMEFEGCFKDVDLQAGENSYYEDFNVNEDCAHFCASQGYILSITNRELCHCTNIMPIQSNLIKAAHELKYVDGRNSPCNAKCPGVVQKGSCMGDECCGGTYRNVQTYSVYSVGGIDPVSVIIRRIKKSLRTRHRNQKWMEDILVTKVCHNNYHRHTILHGSVALNLTARETKVRRSIGTVELCQTLCNRDPLCRSITYFIHNRICAMNKYEIMEAPIIMIDQDTMLFDRNCTTNVELLPTSLQLDVISQDIVMDLNLNPNAKLEPLDDEDFEYDLTNSNNWDTVRRTVAVTDSKDVQINTRTGFETSDTTSRTTEESTTGTDTKSDETSKGYSNEQETGFSVGVSATATAGFNIGFASGSVSTTVEAEMHAAFKFQQSGTDSTETQRTTQKTSTKGRTVSDTNSRVFNRGFIRSSREDKTDLYEFSLTVPPLHKGSIAFFLKKTPIAMKIRTVYNLNGYLMFKVNGIEQEVHVARVLPSEDRVIATLSTVAYDRSTVLAKTTIRDKNDHVIVEDLQKVGEPK